MTDETAARNAVADPPSARAPDGAAGRRDPGGAWAAPWRAMLFDLDGTLADTAPDLAAAVNRMRVARGLAATPYDRLRPVASHGARGLIGAAFGVSPDDSGYEALRHEFLDGYAAALFVDSRLFDGIADVLDALESRGLAWGIVTNKAMRFADPLTRALGFADRTAAIVGGDTTPFAKPHPAPLLHAAALLGIAPGDCVYVGDDLRDIQSGRAAGMRTIAAAWGYCGATEPKTWAADAVLASPADLLALIADARPT